jgi:type VI secretion system secreted protein VgrG
VAETSVRPASVADFTFKVGDKSTEDLKVSGFEGTEGISRLFRFRIMLCSSEPAIAFDEIVGKPCVLEIAGASGSRFVNGIVRRFERSGEGSSLTYYTAVVVPVHWLLTRRHKSRIFQEHNCPDMTVPGIIKKVLQDAGIPEDNYRFALQGSYDKREYVVQYRESEMNFIARLMEEEGIFFFFEHTVDGHKLVFGDSPVAHVPAPNQAELVYRDRTGLVAETEQEHIHEIRDGQEIRIGAVRLDDHNYEQPQVDLMATAAASQYTSLEYSDYPGEYVDKSVGARYATIRLEEFQCRRWIQHMGASARALLPGYKFTLAEHPVAAMNRDYLVTRVVHTARQPQSLDAEAGAGYGAEYKAELRAIPADVPFRPARTTRRPRIHGTQTAIVAGPAGEEIYTDKYGRVKVQFHWDREGEHNEKSSRWVRVSQGSAGGQYGMMFLPRVGQEVVVDFLEGDPDQPIITGRVYNDDLMPPYTLPDEKTKSVIKTHSSKGGGGTNEIRFEDLKDSEQVLVYAQKDLHVRVNNDRVENVDHNRHLTVKENKFELVKQKKHVEVKLDHNEKIGGDMSLEVAGAVSEDFGGNHSENTGGNLYLKAGQNTVIEAAMGLTLKVGSNFIKIDSSGIAIVGTMTKINSGGAAGSGTAGTVNTPEETIDADAAVPGADVTYAATPTPDEALEVEQGEFTPAEYEMEEKITSWVEIELVDEAGQPVPNELYELTYPDGRKRRGKLDERGQAHIGLPEPITVEVTFPHLDADAWERA